MGYAFKRIDRHGKPRYTACYEDLKGKITSAGTFSSKKEADRAWQRAEAEVGKGRDLNLKRGRQTFKKYVEEIWLPNHEVEPTTMQSYHYSIYKHVMPEFGAMRMMDILPEHVRAWIRQMKKNGVSAATIRYSKVVLSAIFTTALNDRSPTSTPAKESAPPPSPRNRWKSSAPSSSTTSTTPSRTPTQNSWSKLPSKPACAGANSPNSAAAT